MRRIQGVVLFAGAALLVACSTAAPEVKPTGPAAAQAKGPRWVRLGSGPCPSSVIKDLELKGDHWCARGIAPLGGKGMRDEHMTEAETNARAAMTRSIETTIESIGNKGSKIQKMEEGSNGTSQFLAAYTSKAKACLRLVAIADTWIDEDDGQIYALAILDNGKFREITKAAFADASSVTNFTQQQKKEIEKNYNDAQDELDRQFKPE